MTLTIYDNLEQGSDDWLAARCGMLTASVIGKLITPTLKVANNDTSRSVINSLVAERITGRVEEVYVSADMERGSMDEPYARNIYREHFAPVDEVGFMVLEEDGRKLGYSPDGIVGADGLIEIKSRKPKVQLATILADTVPAENMAQLQAGLYVSGLNWIDYCSYSGGLPFYTKRVLPDPAWFDVIEQAVTVFETTAAQMLEQYLERTKNMPPTTLIDHELEMSFK